MTQDPKYTPYWWEAAPPREMPDLDVEPNCDVVIVGAGYAGISAALTLARAGLSVQVFDASNPGIGASTRNGGIGSGNLKPSITKLIKTYGPMRATATAIVDRNSDTMHAGQILARMIDFLPRHGRAETDARAGLWETAAVSHVPSYSRTGVHKARTAYNRCYRLTRIGDKNLRGCLAEAHDGLVLDLNEKYWDAVKAGS